MDTKLMQLANAASKYAFEHDLPMPPLSVDVKAWVKAVSDAVEHATDHPDLRYARSWIRADEAFARWRSET